jgi:hypothetical protein
VFWIAALALCAATSLLVHTWTDPVVTRVLGLAVLPAVAAAIVVLWLGELADARSATVGSLQWLTGLQTPGQVVPTCTHWGPGAKWVLQVPVLLIVLGAAVADLLPAVAGVVGVPVGAVATLGGGVVSGVRGDGDPMQFGLRVLTAALGCLVLAALVLRLLHAVYTGVMC